MKLKCIATGSTGNCYTLTSNSGETIILDCGIPIKEIKKGLIGTLKMLWVSYAPTSTLTTASQ